MVEAAIEQLQDNAPAGIELRMDPAALSTWTGFTF